MSCHNTPNVFSNVDAVISENVSHIATPTDDVYVGNDQIKPYYDENISLSVDADRSENMSHIAIAVDDSCVVEQAEHQQ